MCHVETQRYDASRKSDSGKWMRNSQGWCAFNIVFWHLDIQIAYPCVFFSCHVTSNLQDHDHLDCHWRIAGHSMLSSRFHWGDLSLWHVHISYLVVARRHFRQRNPTQRIQILLTILHCCHSTATLACKWLSSGQKLYLRHMQQTKSCIHFHPIRAPLASALYPLPT